MSNQVAEVSSKYFIEPLEQVNIISERCKEKEIGVVPERWVVCKLGQVITFQRGFDLPKRLRITGKVPIVSSSGVSGFHNKAMVNAPGIVTGRYGTIGEVFYLKQDFWPLNTTLFILEFNGIQPKFAFHLLKTIDFESHSGKSGVPGVNRNDIHQEVIILPPKDEQAAIANALSDVDALISELEKLITKKQAIKTATMQQLLTGRTRLPQFALREDGARKGYKQSELGDMPEDWDFVAIDSLNLSGQPAIKAGPFGSSLTKDVYVANGFKVYGQEQVISGDRKFGDYFIDESKFRQLKNCEVITGDILLSLVGTAGKLLIIPIGAARGVINPRLLRFRFDQRKILPVYFKNLVESERIQAYLAKSAQGGTMAVLNASILKNLSIPVPELEEQTSIAAILSDMGEEIQALEHRLGKTRQIKQGMMQELLTGKARLVR